MKEKMKFETPDLTEMNIEKLEEISPNCITEKRNEKGELIKAVNLEVFKQMFSKELVEDGDEAYEFTWVGKRECIVEANKPIRKTLRPCIEESKDWNNTENLYIEGDNLDVLKTLQESYLNSVKMIYIDPPYNTGNDFIYNDDFKMTSEEYREESGELDEDGNRLFKNTDSNGRFHSDWCSMIYSRLVLARNLLSDDGIIFISIDDNEQDNLKKICDEVFGESNFVSQIIWEKNFSPKNNVNSFSVNHDYILCFTKDINQFWRNLLPMTKEQISRYENLDDDIRGPWKSDDLTSMGEGYNYEIITPSGDIRTPSSGRSWIYSEDKFKELLNDNRIWFGKNKNNMPRLKKFITEVQAGIVPLTIWKHNEVGHTQGSKQEIKKIFDNKSIFDTPKPVDLVKKMVFLMTSKDSIILDFFSGSATTAHAVMELNAEDGGNRKFIMVQLPEETDGKSEAYKAGYKNICEIGKERIRRAGEKIKKENKDKEGIENLDTGFRVLKLDDTNMKDVYYVPEEYEQNLLDRLESNIKEDRNDLDLLFGCLLDWGLPLDRPYESRDIDGIKVHIYNHGDLVACFDEGISESIVKEIAKLEPLRVVFRDGSFTSESNRANVEELFKLLSADTSVRVI